MATIKLRRANDITSSLSAIAEGEPVFDKNTDALYVGRDSSPRHIVAKNMCHLMYEELRDMMGRRALFPGMQYMIEDYCTQTNLDELSDANYEKVYKSAEHPFKIIVTADTGHSVNENARVVCRDPYFSDCDFAAWEIKYTPFNDSHCAWALQDYYCSDKDVVYLPTNGVYVGREFVSAGGNTYCIYSVKEGKGFLTTDGDYFVLDFNKSGKGVIYYMKDEDGNECDYDFKNIMYKVYSGYEGGCLKDNISSFFFKDLGLMLNTPTSEYFMYTFCKDLHGEYTDATVENRLTKSPIENNIISYGDNVNQKCLPFVVFLVWDNVVRNNVIRQSLYGFIYQMNACTFLGCDTFHIKDCENVTINNSEIFAGSNIFILKECYNVNILGSLNEIIMENVVNTDFRGNGAGLHIRDLRNSSLTFSECTACGTPDVCAPIVPIFPSGYEYIGFLTCRGDFIGMTNSGCRLI